MFRTATTAAAVAADSATTPPRSAGRRRRLTYANVMSTIAVFMVMSAGTAYAANTIGSIDVINDSLLSADIKNGTLASIDIKDGEVRSPDIRDGAVKLADIDDAAEAQLAPEYEITGTMVNVAGGAWREAQFNCPAGTYATGGGGYSYYDAKGYITDSSPVYGTSGTEYTNKPVGWRVAMQNLSGATNYLVVRVVCSS